MIIGQEKHQDGNLHLHAIIVLKDQFSTSNARFADLTSSDGTIYHGKYERARNLKRSARYCKKDGTFVVLGADITEERTAVSAEIASSLMTGTPIMEIIREYPGFSLMNLRRIREFQEAILPPWTPGMLPPIRSDLSPQDSRILTWLGMNLHCPTPRPIRSKQLFIHGPPMMGKTTLFQLLCRRFRTYFPRTDGSYFDGLTNDHELIIFDDFRCNVRLGVMNMLLDGQIMRLPCRYRDFEKTVNIPVIVATNMVPDCCYSNVDRLSQDAFLSRFKIVEVTEFIFIFAD